MFMWQYIRYVVSELHHARFESQHLSAALLPAYSPPKLPVVASHSQQPGFGLF